MHTPEHILVLKSTNNIYLEIHQKRTYSLYKTEWYYNTYWRQIHIPSCPTLIVYIKQNGIITLNGGSFTYRHVINI
jgi:hypothetical protein